MPLSLCLNIKQSTLTMLRASLHGASGCTQQARLCSSNEPAENKACWCIVHALRAWEQHIQLMARSTCSSMRSTWLSKSSSGPQSAAAPLPAGPKPEPPPAAASCLPALPPPPLEPAAVPFRTLRGWWWWSALEVAPTELPLLTKLACRVPLKASGSREEASYRGVPRGRCWLPVCT